MMQSDGGGYATGTSRRSRTPSHSSSQGEGDGGSSRFHPYRRSKTPSRDNSDQQHLNVKLFVGNIPLKTTEAEFRCVFGIYGDITEVIRIRDGATGKIKECCFVRFRTLKDAKYAIRSLHLQYIFPEADGPVLVRLANGENERLVESKIFVGALPSDVTERQIEEVFLPFGNVEEIIVKEDHIRQNHRYAFVQLPNRDKAVAAITALNGKYMEGCDKPMIVDFARQKLFFNQDSRPGKQTRGVDEQKSSGSHYESSQEFPQSESSGRVGGASNVSPVNPPAPPLLPQQNPLIPFNTQNSERPPMPFNQLLPLQRPLMPSTTMAPPPKDNKQGIVGSNSQVQASQIPQHGNISSNQPLPLQQHYVPVTIQIPLNALQQALVAAGNPQPIPQNINQQARRDLQQPSSLHNTFITVQIPLNAFNQAIQAAANPHQYPLSVTSQNMNQQPLHSSMLPHQRIDICIPRPLPDNDPVSTPQTQHMNQLPWEKPYQSVVLDQKRQTQVVQAEPRNQFGQQQQSQFLHPTALPVQAEPRNHLGQQQQFQFLHPTALPIQAEPRNQLGQQQQFQFLHPTVLPQGSAMASNRNIQGG